MPIYQDYHGDSKDSSISSWDQIQISLKCLLPSYEPILCDSLIVSSFLSDPNQQQIWEDFKQTCPRINTTLHEPEIQANSADPNPEIQKAEYEIGEGIATDSESIFSNSENQHSESSTTFPEIDPEFGKSENTATDSSIANSIQESDHRFTEDEDERFIYLGLEDRNEAVVVQRPPPEPPDSKLLEIGKKELVLAEEMSRRPEQLLHKVTTIHSGAEDGAFAKGNVDADLEPAKIEEELTNNGAGSVFNDSAAEKRERTLAIIEDVDLSCGSSTVHVVDGAGSSAEVGASAREKWRFWTVDDGATKMRCGDLTSDVEDGHRSRAEVSASVKGKWTLSSEAGRTVSMVEEVRAALIGHKARRALPFVGKPSILLAAILPWDRSEEWRSNDVLPWVAVSTRGRGTKNDGVEYGKKAGRLGDVGGVRATAGSGLHTIASAYEPPWIATEPEAAQTLTMERHEGRVSWLWLV